MADELILPSGNVTVQAAREAFTNAVIGVSIVVLVRPDDIDKILDEMLRESARSVYAEAVEMARESRESS